MKNKIKAPIFLAAKTELFYGKMQLLPGEKITKIFFSGKIKNFNFKNPMQRKDEEKRKYPNRKYFFAKKNYKNITSFIQSSHVGQIVPGN